MVNPTVPASRAGLTSAWPVRVAGTPTIVVGLGEFGHEALLALDTAAETRGLQPAPVGVWAGPAGWTLDWHAAPDGIGEPDAAPSPSGEEAALAPLNPDEWWRTHGPDGAGQVQRAVLGALRSTEAHSGTIDVYLIAHLNDPFGRALVMPALAAARQAYFPFTDHVFTLILAADSLSISVLAPADARSLLASLDGVKSELVAAADQREPPGRVGWCYLLDTTDTHGHLLRPAGAGARSAREDQDLRLLQAHQAGEFIALLSAGLRRAPAYRRTSLAHLAGGFRTLAPAARASAFAATSVTLPVRAIFEHARDRLAYQMLSSHIAGQEQPSDLSVARKLRSRWLAECALAPGELRTRIARDRGGQPLSFPTEPPALRGAEPDWLIDIILNWERILWDRWRRPDAPAARMARNGEAAGLVARAWLGSEMDRLLQRETGGARVAALLLAEARQALDDTRHSPARLERREPHLLDALLARLRPAPKYPAELPDLEAGRRRLEAALARRLIPLGIWVRAGLWAMTLYSFAWAAYQAAGRALGAGHLLARWLGLPGFEALDLALFATSAWLLAGAAGWVLLTRTDLAIHFAAARMVADVRRKYAALMERALREEQERAYAGLFAWLAEQAQAVETRSSVLKEAQVALAERIGRVAEAPRLLTEQAALPVSGLRSLASEAGQESDRAQAEAFLQLAGRPHWRSETAHELAAALAAFAAGQLRLWRSSLDLETWASQPGNAGGLAALADAALAGTRPAWPLGREERDGAVVNRPAPLPEAGEPARRRAAPIAANFVGLPLTGSGEPARPPGLDPTVETFCTYEAGRLAVVATLHALEWERLSAWDTARAAAAPENGGLPTAPADRGQPAALQEGRARPRTAQCEAQPAGVDVLMASRGP